MKRIVCFAAAVATMAGVVAYVASASGRDAGEAAPIYGVKIPAGYRNWKMIAVDHLLQADQLRAQLGNDLAIKAFEEGMRSFPDGAIIAAIYWTRVSSEDNDKVLARALLGTQSFVVGSQ